MKAFKIILILSALVLTSCSTPRLMLGPDLPFFTNQFHGPTHAEMLEYCESLKEEQ